jgi:hypothetical protein
VIHDYREDELWEGRYGKSRLEVLGDALLLIRRLLSLLNFISEGSTVRNVFVQEVVAD